ncbi:MAG TPA: PepSY domain-containing protein [Steroidobacteraceae bacterium]|nr:PepSY domain-containing protein [Steroidobacteraceae bacterium]
MTGTVRPLIALTALLGTLLSGLTTGAEGVVQEAQSLTQAKVSLPDAIRLAEQSARGRAVSAAYELGSSSPPYYEIKVLHEAGRKLTRYDLNPNTGKVKGASDERIEPLFTHLRPSSVASARVSLSRAVETAEERAGGKATAAAIERGTEPLRYSIAIARLDGTTENVQVNGSDGTVAAD